MMRWITAGLASLTLALAACAQLPTFEVLDPLRAEFGRPVLSSVQCMAERIGEVAALFAFRLVKAFSRRPVKPARTAAAAADFVRPS